MPDSSGDHHADRSTREEFLEVETTDGRQEIRLDQLSEITPLDKDAKFGRVVLGDE